MITFLTIIRTLLLLVAGFLFPRLLKDMGISRGWRIGILIIFLLIALLSCSKEETDYKPIIPPDRQMPVKPVELENNIKP